MRMSPTSIIPSSLSINSSSPSSTKSPSSRICYGYTKYGCQPSMSRSIPCSIILNDIFLGNIIICDNNHNLVFIPLQCPFTCTTYILRKWILHLVHDGIGKMLVLHHLGTITLEDWLGNEGTLDIKTIFSTFFFTTASIALFFMNPFLSSPLCASSGV
jgi:hypothetical protein